MVTKMLERCIEIEGLLRIIRDGNPLPETYTLLSSKAMDLADHAMLLKDHATEPQRGNAQESTTKIDMKESQTEENKGEKKQTSAEGDSLIVITGSSTETDSKEKEETGDASQAPREEDLHEELTESEEESMDEMTEGKPEMELPDTDTESVRPQAGIEEYEEDDILLTIEDEEGIAEEAEGYTHTEDSLIIEIGHNDTGRPEIQLNKEKQSFKRHTKLKSVFSLNDRFLYSRELFDGNMKMFDSTIDFIEGIEEFPIIEDYFYSELKWDPENMAVASFMEILRPHFRE